MHSRIRSLFVALLCVVMCAAAFAQSDSATSGSINGKVTDGTNTALPGVTVTATNLDTGLTRNRVTDNTGDYTFIKDDGFEQETTYTLEGGATAEARIRRDATASTQSCRAWAKPPRRR